MSTIFDQILSGNLPCAKVYENEELFVFMDAFPQSLGHTLIIPKKSAVDIFTIDSQSLSAIAVFSKRLAVALKKALQADGIKVIQYNGSTAGQTVFYYHMHLIPVWEGKSLNRHGDKSVPLPELEKIATLIRNALNED